MPETRCFGEKSTDFELWIRARPQSAIDLEQQAIAEGDDTVAALALGNTSLRGLGNPHRQAPQTRSIAENAGFLAPLEAQSSIDCIDHGAAECLVE